MNQSEILTNLKHMTATIATMREAIEAGEVTAASIEDLASYLTKKSVAIEKQVAVEKALEAAKVGA